MSSTHIRLAVGVILAIIVIIVVGTFSRDWFARRVFSDQGMPALQCTAEPCPTGDR